MVASRTPIDTRWALLLTSTRMSAFLLTGIRLSVTREKKHQLLLYVFLFDAVTDGCKKISRSCRKSECSFWARVKNMPLQAYVSYHRLLVSTRLHLLTLRNFSFSHPYFTSCSLNFLTLSYARTRLKARL